MVNFANLDKKQKLSIFGVMLILILFLSYDPFLSNTSNDEVSRSTKPPQIKNSLENATMSKRPIGGASLRVHKSALLKFDKKVIKISTNEQNSPSSSIRMPAGDSYYGVVPEPDFLLPNKRLSIMLGREFVTVSKAPNGYLLGSDLSGEIRYENFIKKDEVSGYLLDISLGTSLFHSTSGNLQVSQTRFYGFSFDLKYIKKINLGDIKLTAGAKYIFGMDVQGSQTQIIGSTVPGVGIGFDYKLLQMENTSVLWRYDFKYYFQGLDNDFWLSGLSHRHELLFSIEKGHLKNWDLGVYYNYQQGLTTSATIETDSAGMSFGHRFD